MERSRRHSVSPGRRSLGALAAVLAVAWLGSSIVVVNAATAATTHKAKVKAIVVSTTNNTQLGTILVSGRTVYTLKASKTPCAARCLAIWPELVLPRGVAKAKAGTGVNASKLGTVKRSGGARQVTYQGKPLYWFSGDAATGQVNGNITDTWGKWSVVVLAKPTSVSPPPATNTPTTPAPSPTTGTSQSPARPSPATSPPATSPSPAMSPPTTSSPQPTTPPPPPTTTTTAPSSGGVSF